MKDKAKNIKAIKEQIEEMLDESSLYFENEDGLADETFIDQFTDDWADADSAGLTFTVEGISYTITVRANN